jgi:hypothetical protein
MTDFEPLHDIGATNKAWKQDNLHSDGVVAPESERGFRHTFRMALAGRIVIGQDEQLAAPSRPQFLRPAWRPTAGARRWTRGYEA